MLKPGYISPRHRAWPQSFYGRLQWEHVLANIVVTATWKTLHLFQEHSNDAIAEEHGYCRVLQSWRAADEMFGDPRLKHCVSQLQSSLKRKIWTDFNLVMERRQHHESRLQSGSCITDFEFEIPEYVNFVGFEMSKPCLDQNLWCIRNSWSSM